MTRHINVNQFACVIAGAQKNLGPAGVTMVIVREDMLGNEKTICPSIWNFKKQVEMQSRLNTPPCYRLFFNLYLRNVIIRKRGISFV